MTELDIEHIHEDLIELKRDISVIKHILSEEGQLTEWAKKALQDARSEPEDKYTNLDEL